MRDVERRGRALPSSARTGSPNLHAHDARRARTPPRSRRTSRSHPRRRGRSRACPTTATSGWPRPRASAGAHYFDLTEDVEVTRAVRAHRRRRHAGLRAAVRARAGLHQHRGERADRALRRAAQRQAARRRPAPAPEQRAQVLADLVHRGPDQRIRQSVRGDRRRPAHRGRAARRPRGNRDRRHAVRGVQHLRRPRLARRDATARARRSWTTRPCATRATARRCAC